MITITEKFSQLNKLGKKAFIAYVPFGFPTLASTKDIILALQEAGVDIIELGIPFSDPVADGPIIEQAASIALKNGATPAKLLAMLAVIKSKITIPIVIMSYYNPIHHYGIARFLKDIQKVQVKATVIVDVPIEESEEYIKASKQAKIDPVFFVSPTTSPQRLNQIVRVAQGFIYYVSVTGITGPKDLVYHRIAAHIKKIKSKTKVPVCVGFGIHTRQQVKKVSAISDGVIVGTEIVKFISQHYQRKDFLIQLKKFVRALRVAGAEGRRSPTP